MSFRMVATLDALEMGEDYRPDASEAMCVDCEVKAAEHAGRCPDCEAAHACEEEREYGREGV